MEINMLRSLLIKSILSADSIEGMEESIKRILSGKDVETKDMSGEQVKERVEAYQLTLWPPNGYPLRMASRDKQ